MRKKQNAHRCSMPRLSSRDRTPVMEQPFPNPSRLTQKATIFLTVIETAAFLRVAVSTLGRWRISGNGPQFRKFGRRIVYEYDDLIGWAHQQSRSSTSE